MVSRRSGGVLSGRWCKPLWDTDPRALGLDLAAFGPLLLSTSLSSAAGLANVLRSPTVAVVWRTLLQVFVLW